MTKLDILEVPGRQTVFMSAHPLEDVSQGEDYPDKLKAFIDELKELEVRAVTVLLPRDEFLENYEGTDLIKEYSQAGFEVIHFPLDIFGTPDGIEVFDSVMARIAEALEKIKVLIHCKTGCSRTAMVAAGLLIKLGNTAPQAIAAVHSARPSSNLTVNQIQFLRDYQRYLSRV